MRHSLALIITTLGLVAIGCDDGQQAAASRKPTSASPTPQQRSELQTPTIPADVSYSIIDSTTLRGIKRSLDIRLNKKVSERTLRALGFKLKSQDSRNYERTFIAYYLPEMKVGSGAWATTHFNPDLKVRIYGLTAEQEESLKRQSDDPSRRVVGRWIDDSIFGNRTTIFREDGKLFMERAFADGSSGKRRIVAERSGSTTKFLEEKEQSRSGEYYLIDSRGNLQLWDRDGLVSTAKKIGG